MLRLSRRTFFPNSRFRISNLVRRNAHTEVQRPPGAPKPDGDDPRPPWVYTGSRLGSFTVIPFVAIYAIFVYDWGDHDHVFSPPRRWLAQMKQSFFTLSPAEERLLKGSNDSEGLDRVTRNPSESSS